MVWGERLGTNVAGKRSHTVSLSDLGQMAWHPHATATPTVELGKNWTAAQNQALDSAFSANKWKEPGLST